MADREREKKKKRAYLDDFEKDLNGNYQYRGAHYRYAGEYPHSRVLALLWLFCGSGAALTVGAGALPGATAHAPVYLLLPYMAALVLALYAVVLLVRLTRGGARVRAYIHEQTAQKLPSLCRATAVLCAAASAGQGTAAAVALLRRRCGADRGGGRPARGHGARACVPACALYGGAGGGPVHGGAAGAYDPRRRKAAGVYP